MFAWDLMLPPVVTRTAVGTKTTHFYAVVEERLVKSHMPASFREGLLYLFLLMRVRPVTSLAMMSDGCKCLLVIWITAQAVYSCHTHGVLHRDIKPGNFFPDLPAGKGTLLDFDCAKVLLDRCF